MGSVCIIFYNLSREGLVCVLIGCKYENDRVISAKDMVTKNKMSKKNLPQGKKHAQVIFLATAVKWEEIW